MLSWYTHTSRILSPLVPLYLRTREKRGKEDSSRLRERLGTSSMPRPHGALIWIHAASMGESLSVMPLIRRLIEEHEELHILLTTGTVTSAKSVGMKLPERAYHQFVPVDTPGATKKFLQHWKPDLAVWVESELWPNLMTQAHQMNIPMLLLNGRISRSSAARWHRFPAIIQRLLDCFTLILAKSEEDATRFRNLGGQNVKSCGNLKFSAVPLEADPKITSEILSKIGDRSAWLAASTHPGEEAIVGRIHSKVAEVRKGLLSIIVPRHNTRGAEIAEELKRQGLKVARRSIGEEITSDVDVYLADTIGELGIFYRLCGIVFIGGSLVPHGGQNPFEPARLDCAILYGPHMDNFHEFCHELEAANAAIKVSSEEELAEQVTHLLRDQEAQELQAEKALEAVKALQHVLEDVMKELEPFLAALPGVTIEPPKPDAKDEKTASKKEKKSETKTEA